VGKTTVARALARLALNRGRRPIPYKPVETGCDPDPRDARMLWEAAGRPVALGDVCPYPLPLPAAPAAAADAAGVYLELDELAARGRALAARGDFLITEGAGGLLVPYAGSQTAADLAARLELPVLIVARTALGTVNHSALTVRELGRRSLPVAGLLFSRSQAEEAPHEARNAGLIEALVGVRPLGTLPYLSPAELADDDHLAAALESAIGQTAAGVLLQT
jgi:dethiobiotin synthetase